MTPWGIFVLKYKLTAFKGDLSVTTNGVDKQ